MILAGILYINLHLVSDERSYNVLLYVLTKKAGII